MTPHGELTLRDLLTAEDDPALLEIRCVHTGIPLWTQVRVHFLSMVMSDLFYRARLEDASTGRAPLGRKLATMARSLARNAGARASGAEQADVCFFSAAAGNRLVDGRWHNRYTDHFADVVAGRTLTVEEHFDWRWHTPRANPHTIMQAPMQAWAAVAGRVRSGASHARQARAVVDCVAERARRRFGWSIDPAREATLLAALTRKAAALPVQFDSANALLRRVRPRVTLVGAASYGPSAALIVAARRLGVATAEFQHGLVSAGHFAYNFAAAVQGSDAYRETLPEDFLTYGAWWGEQVDLPVRRTVIGNPHRAECVGGAPRAGEGRAGRRDVLIVSDGIDFPVYLELAEAVAPAAAALGLRTVIRPHPLERASVARQYGAVAHGVAVDVEPDVYASLRAAHVVVSEVSTVMFEAVGLAERVLVWDTPKSRFGMPTHPFARFSTADALAARLADPADGEIDERQVASIWAPGWRARFGTFLRSHGVPVREGAAA